MSLSEKFVSLMSRPGDDNQPKDNHPWYLKYGARIAGSIGAVFAMMFGLFNCLSLLTINISCFIFGVFQIISGILVLVIESPCCFVCADQFQKVANVADNRPLWQRAAVYCTCGIIPIIFCFSLASLFPGVILFATGVLYGMMGLGKKASQDDMAAMASSPNAMSADQGALSSLDQRSTLMEDPDVWRPT